MLVRCAFCAFCEHTLPVRALILDTFTHIVWTVTDFCSGGEEETPDMTVINILKASDFEEDEITYEATQYYAMVGIGCFCYPGCKRSNFTLTTLDLVFYTAM